MEIFWVKLNRNINITLKIVILKFVRMYWYPERQHNLREEHILLLRTALWYIEKEATLLNIFNLHTLIAEFSFRISYIRFVEYVG